MAARVIPRIVLALLSFAAIASHASGQIAYTVTDLGSGDAYAINASGQVVGQTGSDNAFLYSNGVTQNLGSGIALGINDSGQVVGQLNGQGFLYSDGVVSDHRRERVRGRRDQRQRPSRRHYQLWFRSVDLRKRLDPRHRCRCRV